MREVPLAGRSRERERGRGMAPPHPGPFFVPAHAPASSSPAHACAFLPSFKCASASPRSGWGGCLAGAEDLLKLAVGGGAHLVLRQGQPPLLGDEGIHRIDQGEDSPSLRKSVCVESARNSRLG